MLARSDERLLTRSLGRLGTPSANSTFMSRITSIATAGGQMSPQPPRPAPSEEAKIAGRRAVMARDAGLRRISRVTRWMIVGVVAPLRRPRA